MPGGDLKNLDLLLCFSTICVYTNQNMSRGRGRRTLMNLTTLLPVS